MDELQIWNPQDSINKINDLYSIKIKSEDEIVEELRIAHDFYAPRKIGKVVIETSYDESMSNNINTWQRYCKYLPFSQKKAERILEIKKQIEAPVKEYKIYNMWNFVFDSNYGVKCFGQQPAGEIFNLLYYYTQENDLIWDVFAGGGTVMDVCKAYNRKCYSTDINPLRDEIHQMDVTKDLPEIDPQLIYIDPPYPVISKGHYTDKDTDFSNMEIDEFYEQIDDLLEMISRIYSKALIAYIIGGTLEIEGGKDFALESFKIIDRYYNVVRRIIVPYSTQNYRADHVNKAKEGKYMLNLYRDLFICGRK